MFQSPQGGEEEGVRGRGGGGGGRTEIAPTGVCSKREPKSPFGKVGLGIFECSFSHVFHDLRWFMVFVDSCDVF